MTEKCFIDAAEQGRFWLTKRLLASRMNPDCNNGEALRKAVSNGRMTIVRLLLQNGAKLDSTNSAELVLETCRKGYSRILKELLSYGVDIPTDALKEAILHGNTSCVRVLIEHGADIHQNGEEALMLACQGENINIIKLLLDEGADIDARDGEALVTACENCASTVVEYLIKRGADVTIDEDRPLKRAAHFGHVGIILVLLDAGANKSVLEELELDEATEIIVKTFNKIYRLQRLRTAIKESFKQADFKYQDLCRPCFGADANENMRITKLKEQSDLWRIPPQSLDNVKGSLKRVLCAAIAKEHDQWSLEKPRYPEEYTDLSGTPINDLPFWKIHVVDGHPFNIFDLFRMIKSDIDFNPYTKKELPLEEIEERRRFLSKILTKERFKDFNLLDTIRDSPLMSDNDRLADKLFRQVWDEMFYPPSMSIILDAEDDTIDEMLDAIVEAIQGRSTTIYHFYWDEPRNTIYPMVTPSVTQDIHISEGYEKKSLFVNLLCDIASQEDHYKDTRVMMLSIIFKKFGNGSISDSGSSSSDDEMGNQNLLQWHFGDFDSGDSGGYSGYTSYFD